MYNKAIGFVLMFFGLVIFLILQVIPIESISNQFDSTNPPNPDSQWNYSVNPDLHASSNIAGNVVGFICVVFGIVCVMRDS